MAANSTADAADMAPSTRANSAPVFMPVTPAGRAALISPTSPTGSPRAADLTAPPTGVEPTSDEAVSAAPDVLKELMNVTCGVLMRRLSGVPSDGLSMSLPVAVELPVSEWNGITADTDTIVLDVEGSNAALKVTGME